MFVLSSDESVLAVLSSAICRPICPEMESEQCRSGTGLRPSVYFLNRSVEVKVYRVRSDLFD